MLSERNYWRDEDLGCILFNIIVLPTLATVRDICWLANLPEISNTVWTTVKTKMATSPTMPAISHSGFLKILTRFHKKSTHRNLLRTLMYKTQKKSSTTEPPRTATHDHKFPATRGFLIQICADLRKFLENWCNHSIHRPTIYKTWKLQAQKRPYVPPRAAIDPRWPTAKPLKTMQICP